MVTRALTLGQLRVILSLKFNMRADLERTIARYRTPKGERAYPLQKAGCLRHQFILLLVRRSRNRLSLHSPAVGCRCMSSSHGGHELTA